jgi:hypothetical protein
MPEISSANRVLQLSAGQNQRLKSYRLDVCADFHAMT